jgi:hypothetical protein
MADTQSSNSNKLVPVGGQKTGRTASVLPGKFRQQTGLVRNLTRLTIGLTIQALETVADQLQEAEQETLLQRTPEPAPQDEIVVEMVKGKPVVSSPGRRPPPSTRHTFIGFIFEAQSRLGEGLGRLQEAGQDVESRVNRTLSPVTSSRAFAPIRRRVDVAVRRAQNQIHRWEDLGRVEEAYSRELSTNTVDKLLDSTADYVNQNPHVREFIQDIIQAQSMGMADEAIEEVRERTVTGDILLERFVRSIFRRQPRESLPLPPTAKATNGALPPTKSKI